MEYIHPEAAFTAPETEALTPDDITDGDSELDGSGGLRATNGNGHSADMQQANVNARLNGARSDGARSDGARSDGARSDGERSDSERYSDDSDPHEALGHLKNAARRNPASARHLAELAEGYAAADLPHQALRQYQRALQTQRDAGEEEMPDTHLGIGDLCRTFAMSAVAVRSYERAVRLRPRRPYYRWKLGVALAALGLYEQAVSQLQTAIELAPKDTYYRFQLADVFLLMGCEEQAIDSLETVVALAPRDDYYRLRLGAALLRAGRSDEAIAHFERAVQLQPKNPSHRTLLRYAYTRNGQEPAISVDIEMLELGAYDEDFVRRIQRLAQPVA